MGRGGVVIHRRLIVIIVVMGLWAGAISYQLYSLQVVQSNEFKDRALRQHERVLQISPRRGTILDRNGAELAISIEVDSLYAVASEIEDPRATAVFLSEVLNISIPSLESRLASGQGFTWVRRKISKRAADRIRTENILGLYFQKESKRFYPNRQLASHVLGFVNLDDEGGSGIEYLFDDLIGGTEGKVIVMTDARGRSFHSLEQLPTSGASLTTTIDQTIQYIAEKEVERTVSETQAAGVSVVVMDPNNGEVLAMANYPQFNPNEYGQFPQDNWRNRAVSQIYEPGSTFKIVTAVSALEEQLTTLEELIDCQMGHIDIFGHRIHDHKPFGILSVREVLQFSSDVGIIKLGMRIGDERFADYITKMGFGQKTGIDLPGEERGLFRPASDWSNVSVGAISMGQEIGTTPLQIVNMVSAVANGGILYQPYVVKNIDDPRTVQSNNTESVGRRVMSEKTAHLLQDALQTVVSNGTGANAQISGYTAAGKTGTAQKIDTATGTYSLTNYVASFSGFAPVSKPEVAVIVVIDEPVGRHGGGEVAAPAFKRIVEAILRYRSVPPDAPESLPRFIDDSEPPEAPIRRQREAVEELDDQWDVVDVAFPDTRGASIIESEIFASGIVVPDFRGSSLRQATQACLQLGLRCQTSGSGIAIEQSLIPGTFVERENQVQVLFSTNSGARGDTDIGTLLDD